MENTNNNTNGTNDNNEANSNTVVPETGVISWFKRNWKPVVATTAVVAAGGVALYLFAKGDTEAAAEVVTAAAEAATETAGDVVDAVA